MHVLCLSLRISSFFLRILPQKVHNMAFSTNPAPKASLGQLCLVASGLLSGSPLNLWCKDSATLRRMISDAEAFQFDFRAQLLETVPLWWLLVRLVLHKLDVFLARADDGGGNWKQGWPYPGWGTVVAWLLPDEMRKWWNEASFWQKQLQVIETTTVVFRVIMVNLPVFPQLRTNDKHWARTSMKHI